MQQAGQRWPRRPVRGEATVIVQRPELGERGRGQIGRTSFSTACGGPGPFIVL